MDMKSSVRGYALPSLADSLRVGGHPGLGGQEAAGEAFLFAAACGSVLVLGAGTGYCHGRGQSSHVGP